MIQKMVSLTSQNQISIPSLMVVKWGVPKPNKLFLTQVGDEVHLRPVKDFWSIVGSLKSEVHLTEKELNEARARFATDWAQKT